MFLPARSVALTAFAAAIMSAAPVRAAEWTSPVRITPRHARVTDLTLALDAHGDALAAGTLDDPPDDPAPYVTVAYSAHRRGAFGAATKLLDYEHAPAVAFDRRGTAHVILSFENDSVVEMERPPGGEFGPPRAIAPAGSPLYLTLSPVGDLFAYWLAQPTGARRPVLRVAVRPRGASRFGPARRVSARGARARLAPQLSLDRAGNAMLAWTSIHRRADGSRVVRVVYTLRPRGGKFGPRRRLGIMPTTRSDFAVASNRAGRAVAVWQALRDGRREVRAALGGVRSGFGQSTRLARGTSDTPVAAVAPSGDAMVAWPKGNGDQWPYSDAHTADAEVTVATAPPGGDLGSPRVVFNGPSIRLVASAGASRTLLAAWRERPRGELVAARRIGGRRWRVSRFDPGEVNWISAGATSRGRVVLVWHSRARNGEKRIRASVAEPDRDLGPVTTIARPGREGAIYSGPDLAFDREDGAFAFWSVGGYGVDQNCCGLVQEHSGSYLLP